MDTEDIVVMASQAGAAREAEAAKRQYAEFRKVCSGGTMVFAGLMLAVVYSLLTRGIPM